MPNHKVTPEPKEVKRFETTDGTIFEDQTEAAIHQLQVNFIIICEDLGLGRGGTWFPREIAEALWERRDDLAVIFETEAVLRKVSS